MKVLKLLTPIEREAAKCHKCKIGLTRKQSVFGLGNPLAQLVVLGEGPGEDEDRSGLPFQGKAGRLLHRGLEAIGYNDKNTYFCNIVKCRACTIMDSGWAKNRTPDPEEISNCSKFLIPQISALPNKKVILACGSTAMHWLLGAEQGTLRIGAVRMKFLELRLFKEVVGIVTYHPSYLLRDENAESKGQVYEDFKLARDYLAGKYGAYEYLQLKSRGDFEDRDWNEPLARGPEVEKELKAVQKPGVLLPSQKDRYHTRIEVWGDGPIEESDGLAAQQPKPVFGQGFKVPAKGKKHEPAPALFAQEVTDDDVPF